MRPLEDVMALEKLLHLVFGYERTEVTELLTAVEQVTACQSLRARHCTQPPTA